ncbi:MAG: FTR1 family protein [Alphaproteobacteria bacterium]|jgi:high-affinity iron transporter|nr:FTR1 family protein [Alphaproteobacteria bacterium]|tara:strand:+ start:484 stop:1695 length:1212 start_codon:yes stop_codon:yes gene_type:complete
MIFRLIATVFVALSVLAPIRATAADPVDIPRVVGEIIAKGDVAIKAYDPGDGFETADTVSSLYFDVFEDSGMETVIGMKDAGLKTELESLFGRVIGLASRGSPPEAVETAWTDLRWRLKETAESQEETTGGFVSTLFQSFLILLREGFEAILVITALITYLRRSDQGDKVWVIYHGVGWALAASLSTAYLMTFVLEVSGTSREVLEGVTMLIAAAVLFYVSYWLLAKRETERWQKYVHDQVDKALSAGRLFTLGFAAFLAVYREGAETVLFYLALVAGTEGQIAAITTGFMVAILCLAGLFWAMRTASFRLPLGVFFSTTAALLYCLAVIFAGKGVLELQEARWVSITPLNWIPQVEWLGLFSTAETIAAQLVLVVPLVLAAVYWLWKRRVYAAMKAKNAQSC